PTDLKWVREILKIIEESGLASDMEDYPPAYSGQYSLAEISSEFSVALVEDGAVSDIDTEVELEIEPLRTEDDGRENASDSETLMDSPPITASALPRVTSSSLATIAVEDLSPEPKPSQNGGSKSADKETESNPAESGNVRNTSGFRPVVEHVKNSGNMRAVTDVRSSGTYRPASETSKYSFSDQTAMVVD